MNSVLRAPKWCRSLTSQGTHERGSCHAGTTNWVDEVVGRLARLGAEIPTVKAVPTRVSPVALSPGYPRNARHALLSPSAMKTTPATVRIVTNVPGRASRLRSVPAASAYDP